MAARAASGYPSPTATAVTLGRHSDPLQSRPSSESHARPASEPHAQLPVRRPSPPPLVRTDHVPRAAHPRVGDPRAGDPRAGDPRADLMIDTRLDPRAPPGHPYYASARSPAVTPPNQRIVGGVPPGAPGASRHSVHHRDPYHAQPAPVPRARLVLVSMSIWHLSGQKT